MIPAGWDRIDPGSAPGGLVFRLTAAGRVWAEHLIPADGGPEPEAAGEADRALAAELVCRRAGGGRGWRRGVAKKKSGARFLSGQV